MRKRFKGSVGALLALLLFLQLLPLGSLAAEPSSSAGKTEPRALSAEGETKAYHIYFQPIDDEGQPKGEPYLIGSEGLQLKLSEMNKDGDAGYLSIPDYEGRVWWRLAPNNINLYVGAMSALVSADKAGSVVLRATAADEDGWELEPAQLVAELPLCVIDDAVITGARVRINNTIIDQTVGYQIAGSGNNAVSMELQYDNKNWKPVSNALLTLSSSEKFVSVYGASFVFNKPGAATLTVSAQGKSICVPVESSYVPIESIKPGVDRDGDTIYLHDRNPSSEGGRDFAPLRQLPNVQISPANASFGAAFDLTSSASEIAQFVESMVVSIVPYKAGKVSFTATSKDPQLAENQKSGTATVSFQYQNPVQSVSRKTSNMTLAVNKTEALELVFTGPLSQYGYHVSEAGLSWQFQGEGAVEISRSSECFYPKSTINDPNKPYASEFFVSNDQYFVTGVKAGSVTAVGTPLDQTGGAQPITLHFEVDAGTAEQPADLHQQMSLGIRTGQQFLESQQKEPYAFGAEWEIFALLRSGRGVDSALLEPYFSSVASVYKGNPSESERKPTTLARVALTLAVAGKDPTNFEGLNFISLLCNSPGMSMGCNEPMWALLTLDSQAHSIPAGATWNRETLLTELLRYQNSTDGGFGLFDNKTTSVDITAMALQALAPYRGIVEVDSAISKGLDYLRSMQNRDGGFENCESAAQVLTTLSTLGLDAMSTENGFVKGINRNLIMNVQSFRVAESPYGYIHVAGTLPQLMTTSQVVYSFEAYSRYLSGGKSIYDFGDLAPLGRLETQVRNAKRLLSTDYTKESWSGFALALSAAEALLGGMATEQALLQAQAQLQAATKALVIKPVQKPPEILPPTQKIRVSFRLVGDTPHGEEKPHTKYQTWIKTKSYTLAKGSTVFDLYVLALREAGLNFEETQHDYIGRIQAPAVLGAYWLSEFGHGAGSGWKYLINGSYPGVGLRSKPLSEGDAVVFRYIDDHRNEYDNSDKWLEAPDSAPTAAEKPPTAVVEDGVEFNPPAVVDRSGKASVTLDHTTLNKLIASASKADSSSIIISPTGMEKASKLTVDLPKSALANLAKDTRASLIMHSGFGTVELPHKALNALIEQANGSDISVSVEKVEPKAVQAALAAAKSPLGQSDLPEGSILLQVSIASGKKPITRFGGEALKLSLPAPTAAKAGEIYKVYVLSDDGSVEQLEGKAVKQAGKLVVAIESLHLSTFIVTTEKTTHSAKLPFVDVAPTDWFFEAVGFVAQKKLFAGTEETRFSPNSSMTRAMLVTVLWRMAGQPSTNSEAAFADVPANCWYSPAVSWAKQLGIVSGNGSSFDPDGHVTREQLAALLYRYSKISGADISVSGDIHKFTDQSAVSDWASQALTWALGKGLIGGRDARTLAPQVGATRAEVAIILQRYLTK